MLNCYREERWQEKIQGRCQIYAELKNKMATKHSVITLTDKSIHIRTQQN